MLLNFTYNLPLVFIFTKKIFFLNSGLEVLVVFKLGLMGIIFYANKRESMLVLAVILYE